jgi:hypothetical protein
MKMWMARFSLLKTRLLIILAAIAFVPLAIIGLSIRDKNGTPESYKIFRGLAGVWKSSGELYDAKLRLSESKARLAEAKARLAKMKSIRP